MNWVRGLLLLAIMPMLACSAASYDAELAANKSAILESVHNYLTTGDCANAVIAIDPLYASKQVDNDVRMARASAYACAGGLSNFFAKFGELILASSMLVGPGFWNTMSEMFYVEDDNEKESRITAGYQSQQALMATLTPGQVVAIANSFDATDRNPKSLLPSDRIDDSNAYLMFVAMSTVGNMQNLYGAADPTTFARGQIMGATASNAAGWTDATKVDFNACLYASSLLNLFDAIYATGTDITGSASRSMTQIATTFADLIGDACNAGCQGGTYHIISYTTGCAFTDDDCKGIAGRRCPASLRNPASCTGAVDDRASCAAAGIATFISKDPLIGWQQ